MSKNDEEVRRLLDEHAARVAARVLTERELEDAGTFARAALAVAGHELSPEAEERVSQAMRREISHDEFVRLAKADARREAELD